MKDGTVVTWEDEKYCGGCKKVKAALRGADKIYAIRTAFAAVLKDVVNCTVMNGSAMTCDRKNTGAEYLVM